MSKYATERLGALWDRVESLERTVEVAGAFLERGISETTPEAFYLEANLALTALRTGIQETFRGSLLCDRETTDAQLDVWLADATAAEVTTDGG